MAEVLVPALASFAEQFDATKKDARDLFAGLTQAQFGWRPAPGRWSIGECVAHLNTSGDVYLPRIDAMIEEARAKGYRSQGPYKHHWIGHTFARSFEPPPRFRAKAPKVFLPPPVDHAIDRTTAAFLKLQDSWMDRLQRANGFDLGRVRTMSPVTSLIKLTLEETFLLMAGHQRRHLWQARNVKNALPKA